MNKTNFISFFKKYLFQPLIYSILLVVFIIGISNYIHDFYFVGEVLEDPFPFFIGIITAYFALMGLSINLSKDLPSSAINRYLILSTLNITYVLFILIYLILSIFIGVLDIELFFLFFISFIYVILFLTKFDYKYIFNEYINNLLNSTEFKFNLDNIKLKKELFSCDTEKNKIIVFNPKNSNLENNALNSFFIDVNEGVLTEIKSEIIILLEQFNINKIELPIYNTGKIVGYGDTKNISKFSESLLQNVNYSPHHIELYEEVFNKMKQNNNDFELINSIFYIACSKTKNERHYIFYCFYKYIDFSNKSYEKALEEFKLLFSLFEEDYILLGHINNLFTNYLKELYNYGNYSYKILNLNPIFPYYNYFEESNEKNFDENLFYTRTTFENFFKLFLNTLPYLKNINNPILQNNYFVENLELLVQYNPWIGSEIDENNDRIKSLVYFFKQKQLEVYFTILYNIEIGLLPKSHFELSVFHMLFFEIKNNFSNRNLDFNANLNSNNYMKFSSTFFNDRVNYDKYRLLVTIYYLNQNLNILDDFSEDYNLEVLLEEFKTVNYEFVNKFFDCDEKQLNNIKKKIRNYIRGKKNET